MLERLHVKNFRGLRDLEIDGLAPINLIGGRNNSGKTSLLEALFLLSTTGNPEVALNPNLIRGAGAWDPSTGSGPWRELFLELDEQTRIDIAVTHAKLGELNLSVETEWPTTAEASIELAHDASARESSSSARQKPTLVFRYRRSSEEIGLGEETVEARLRISGPQFEIEQPDRDIPFHAAILLSRGSVNHLDLANRLGDLTRERRVPQLLEALQVIEPELRSIEALPGISTPMIWCDIGLPELVPLPVLGEGMTNLTRFVLWIAASADGLVLVDEIENGFHHSILPDVWKVIGKPRRTQTCRSSRPRTATSASRPRSSR